MKTLSYFVLSAVVGGLAWWGLTELAAFDPFGVIALAVALSALTLGACAVIMSSCVRVVLRCGDVTLAEVLPGVWNVDGETFTSFDAAERAFMRKAFAVINTAR